MSCHKSSPENHGVLEGKPSDEPQMSIQEDVRNFNKAISVNPRLNDWSEKCQSLCHSLTDPYLAYICLRVSYRPHMRLFVTSEFHYSFYNMDQPKLESLPVVEGCGSNEPLLNLFCTYSKVAHLARQDEKRANSICDMFEDDCLKGECEFYRAISAVMALSENLTSARDYLFDHCEEINHSWWKSECFFLLADELSQLKEPDIQDIVLACERSSDIEPSFLCFNHLAYSMASERALAFCNAVRGNERYKRECILGLFPELGGSIFESMPSAITACLDLSEDYQKYCFRAIGNRVYEGLYDPDKEANKGLNRSTMLELCGLMPQKYEYDCIYGAWIRTADESQGHLDCAEFPQDYTSRCQKHLAFIQEAVDNGLADWDGSPTLLGLPESTSNSLSSS